MAILSEDKELYSLEVQLPVKQKMIQNFTQEGVCLTNYSYASWQKSAIVKMYKERGDALIIYNFLTNFASFTNRCVYSIYITTQTICHVICTIDLGSTPLSTIV